MQTNDEGRTTKDERRRKSSSRAVTAWLFTVCVLIMVMVVFGGYVRLTRSGLSIVEWNVVSGVVPPVGKAAWQVEFAKYQQSPEYQKVNATMTLAQYKRIFIIEYVHRLIARLAGLVVVIPLLVFLFRGMIPWRRSGIYLLIAVLFGFQGFLGWYMVSSGLVDRPSVSHYRLTIHLLAALTILALTLWTALDHVYGKAGARRGTNAAGARAALVLLAILVVQIAYGGLVAGLKAGHVSNTFPLMYGRLVPPQLLSTLQPWWENLVATAMTVHFVHRWFAFVVLLMAAVLYAATRGDDTADVRRGVLVLLLLVGLQIALGISVVWWGVPLVLALLHQANALLLFVAVVFLNHRLRGAPRRVPSLQLQTDTW